MEEANYEEILKAFKGIDGRKIKANFGLDPKLGKYHRTYCLVCDSVIKEDPPVLKCPVSDKHRVVVGVKDRLMMIRDRENPLMDSRPPIFIRFPWSSFPKWA